MESYSFLKNIFLVIFCLGVFTVVFNPALGTPVTQTDLISQRPQIHSYDNDLFIVWTERSEVNSEVYFSKSDDGGTTFSKPLNLSNNLGDSAFPRMKISENNIFVTWYDYSPGQSDVFFAKSSDFGETFSIENISDNISASYNPWIEASSDFVYLVWNDGGKSQEITIKGKSEVVDILVGDAEIMFGFSDDKGKTFEIKNVSNMSGDSFNPRMRIDDTKVYLVWTDHVINSEIFFSKSSDSSFSFSEPLNISNSGSKSSDAGIQIYDESIFVIWKEKLDTGTEIYFSKSNDDGDSFTHPVSLSGGFGDFKITRDTQIDVSYPHLYTAYYDERNSEVYLAHSPDMGDTFYDPINLSTSSGKSIFPQLVTEENKVFVIWGDDSDGDFDVFLRESHDYGYVFGPKINLSNDSNDSEIFVLGPQISKSKNFINVIWENKTESKSDLLLKQKSINHPPLSFLFSDSKIEISLKGYEIQPEKETQIEIEFPIIEKENGFLKNHSLLVLDSENKTIIQSIPDLIVNGSAYHNVIFPKPGQYSLKLDFENIQMSSNDQILVRVIPEFEFVIFLILSISISLVIFSKRIQPRIFR